MSVLKVPHHMAGPRRSRWLMTRGLQLRLSVSGQGGAKLFRHNFGEQIGNVAGTGEFHWRAGNFPKYAGLPTVNDLPVDAHQLIALCAPRPGCAGAGATHGDGRLDATGMFLAEVGAGSLYKLLGKKDLGSPRVCSD